MKKIIVISDVDGCLTDGRFIYTEDGKVAKMFGPHDHDGVKMLRKEGIDIVFISADVPGFPITKKRISDMHCNLYQVSEQERLDFIETYKNDNTFIVFFGDGVADAKVKTEGKCDLFIAPLNARPEATKVADFVTTHIGGDGAFLDMALIVLDLMKCVK